MDFHDNFHNHPSPITSQIVLTTIPLQLVRPSSAQWLICYRATPKLLWSTSIFRCWFNITNLNWLNIVQQFSLFKVKNHPKQKTEHPIGVVFLSRRVQWLLLSTINYTATPKKSHMRKRKRNPATIPSTPELETRGVPYIYIYIYTRIFH